MATLFVQSMQCKETETVFGMDQCSLRFSVDGGPDQILRRDMKTGEKWEIGESFVFNDRVHIELWELDGGPPPALDPDDKLGVHEVAVSDWGEHTHEFTYRGSQYLLRYRVE